MIYVDPDGDRVYRVDDDGSDAGIAEDSKVSTNVIPQCRNVVQQMAIRDFRELVYTKYEDLTFIDDLTPCLLSGTYSSRLHGGPDKAKLLPSRPDAAIWEYLRAEAQLGRHFSHLVITEGLD